MKAKPLSEAHIQRTCTEFLALDDWRCIRTDPVSDRARGKGFGEVGMADCLYLRYWGSLPGGAPYGGVGNILWIEWKRPGGKPSNAQTQWHKAERRRGAITLIAGIDFPASIEGFMAWYAQSDLDRRNLRGVCS